MNYTKTIPLIVIPFLVTRAQPPYAPKAERMVRNAVDYARHYGMEKVIQQTNLPQGQFHVGNGSGWYLFILDRNGTLRASGYNPENHVGRNLMDQKDPDGKRYIRAFLETSMSNGSGWVDYCTISAPGNRMGPRTAYVEGYGNFTFGCGVCRE
ncbi:MAG: cache domain-containing protein [Holophaga sp.]|nr:cache domain-containing protein [Holophaga sp.]